MEANTQTHLAIYSEIADNLFPHKELPTQHEDIYHTDDHPATTE